jgi:ribosomal protein S18 acetylase RimI-like enzyme
MPEHGIAIRESTLRDEPAVLAELRARWSGRVVSRGKLHPLVELPVLVAEADGVSAGALTYARDDDAIEVVTLDAFVPGRGVGRALMLAVAAKSECVWLVTTNDNHPAQRFYSTLGMTLVGVHRDALVASRLLKPEIPLTGIDGVPIQDEYVYEWRPAHAVTTGAELAQPGDHVVQVRPFVPEEWRLYRWLRIRALADAPDAFSSTLARELACPESWWRERLAGVDGANLPLLAEAGGHPAGLAWGRIAADRRGTAHLFQMWVDPAFRASGAGGRLVAAVVDWAQRCGAREVLLGVTRGNGPANRLYLRAGFVPIGEEPLRPGSPLVVDNMRLDLG